jgi:hypothetical protein
LWIIKQWGAETYGGDGDGSAEQFVAEQTAAEAERPAEKISPPEGHRAGRQMELAGTAAVPNRLSSPMFTGR